MKIFTSLFLIIFISCTSKTSLSPKMKNKKNLIVEREKKNTKEAKKIKFVEKTTSSDDETIVFSSYQDSFLRKINAVSDSTVSLVILKKDKTKYEELEIWSAQIASSSNKLFAQKLKKEVEEKYALKVFIKSEYENFKVLVGRKVARDDLNQLLGELKHYGFQSAWAVKHKIKEVIKTYEEKVDYPYFSLQVGTYSSEISAKKAKKEIESQSNLELYLLEERGLYKVLVERKKNKEALTQAKQLLAKLGYKVWFREFK